MVSSLLLREPSFHHKSVFGGQCTQAIKKPKFVPLVTAGYTLSRRLVCSLPSFVDFESTEDQDSIAGWGGIGTHGGKAKRYFLQPTGLLRLWDQASWAAVHSLCAHKSVSELPSIVGILSSWQMTSMKAAFVRWKPLKFLLS